MQTNRDDIHLALREFLEEHSPGSTATLSDSDSLFDNGILDSLGIVALVVFIEDHFGIILEQEDLGEESLSSLSAIANTVEIKLKNGKSAK